MSRSMYDPSQAVWGQPVPSQAVGAPPSKPKHQHVGCFAYLGLMIGFFGILAGSYALFMVVADMPGRGKMPPAFEWVVIFGYLIFLGLLPRGFSIRSILRTRRINRTNEENYRRALAQYGQVNTDLHEQYPWMY